MWFNEANVSYGEAELIKWQYRMQGGFKSTLWDAISKADTGNQQLLAKGFPDEVEAYRRFSGESGYWEDVLLRAGVLEME